MNASRQAGSVNIETLLGFLLALMIVPPLVCCALQTFALMVGMIVPWLTLAVVGIAFAVCLTTGLHLRRQPAASDQESPIPLPPIRRPAGLSERHRDRDRQ